MAWHGMGWLGQAGWCRATPQKSHSTCPGRRGRQSSRSRSPAAVVNTKNENAWARNFRFRFPLLSKWPRTQTGHGHAYANRCVKCFGCVAAGAARSVRQSWTKAAAHAKQIASSRGSSQTGWQGACVACPGFHCGARHSSAETEAASNQTQ